MSKKMMEKLLLSELAEVNGGQFSQDCICTSGAAEAIIIESPQDPEPIEPGGPVYC